MQEDVILSTASSLFAMSSAHVRNYVLLNEQINIIIIRSVD
jgi:hypothetical protein